jgi:hypothetical protein
MHAKLAWLLLIIVFLATGDALKGDSATWNANPVTNDWGLAANWTPATIPFGETAVATFGVSNVTDVAVSSSGQGNSEVMLGGITFTAGASSYTLTVVLGAYD